MRIFLIIIVLALKHYMRIANNSLINVDKALSKFSDTISVFINDLIKKIYKFLSLMVYSWVFINFVLCIILNLCFRHWVYIDYIWISVIITLMITSLIDTFRIIE